MVSNPSRVVNRGELNRSYARRFSSQGDDTLRVAIDGRTLEATHSGVGTYVLQLVRALCRLNGDEDYRLIIRRPEMVNWSSLPRLTPWPTRFSHESHPWGDLWENLWLPHRLRQEGIDLFHGPAFRIPLLPTTTPLVVTIHDLVAFRQPHTIPRRYGFYMRRITRWAARRAQRIIAVSRTTCEDIISVLGVSPQVVRTIPLGVGEEFTDESLIGEREREWIRDRYGLLGDYILFVGNLEPRKNLPVLIRAFGRIRRQHRAPLQLALCGKRAWLSRSIASALEESPVRDEIVLTGYVPRTDLPPLYRGAKVFVLPSVSEGFGLPILEAMACGTPVVASIAAAIPEVVGNAGLLVAPGDEDSLVKALHSILDDEDLSRDLRQRGIERAQQFSWHAVARKTLDVYRELTESSP